jgi:hypothetical protein
MNKNRGRKIWDSEEAKKLEELWRVDVLLITHERNRHPFMSGFHESPEPRNSVRNGVDSFCPFRAS